MLTSPANPLIKDVRRALARGGLTGDGYLAAEGFHLLDEALRSDIDVKVVLTAESVQPAVRDRLRGRPAIRVAVVDDAVFRILADTESSQGVMTLAAPPVWKLEQLFRGQTLVVALDGLQDPGNAGAIVRAAEAFGATGRCSPRYGEPVQSENAARFGWVAVSSSLRVRDRGRASAGGFRRAARRCLRGTGPWSQAFIGHGSAKEVRCGDRQRGAWRQRTASLRRHRAVYSYRRRRIVERGGRRRYLLYEARRQRSS